MSNQKIHVDGDVFSGSVPAESAREGSLDRLSALLPADALEDALAGLEPEDITGPGGLITQLAGRVVEAALGAELSEYFRPGRRRRAARATTATGRHPRR